MDIDKKELIDLYQRYRTVIFPVLVGLTALMLVFLVIYPQINKLVENNNAYNGIINKTAFLEVKAKDLETFNEADLQRKVNISLTALPDGQDYAQVITIIQGIVQSSGFTLS